MTQTIEQLTARVRELEEENARLNGVIESNIDDGIDKIMAMSDEQVSALAGFEGSNPEDKATIARQCMDIAMLRVDLAASQAYAEQLREALQTFIDEHEECTDADDWMAMLCSIEAHHVAEEALALPRDTSALDAYVAKRLHDMACDKGLLRIQVEELTRQRDLAVDALERVARYGGWWARDVFGKTMAIIRESENENKPE